MLSVHAFFLLKSDSWSLQTRICEYLFHFDSIITFSEFALSPWTFCIFLNTSFLQNYMKSFGGNHFQEAQWSESSVSWRWQDLKQHKQTGVTFKLFLPLDSRAKYRIFLPSHDLEHVKNGFRSTCHVLVLTSIINCLWIRIYFPSRIGM